MHREQKTSLSRLSAAFQEPRSSVGRWIASQRAAPARHTRQPEERETGMRQAVRQEAMRDRQRCFGYRRITAALRRRGYRVNRKAVCRVMREEGLLQERAWHRPARPYRVEKMRPERPDLGWQVDMTSFQLSNLVVLYLVVVLDCFTREIVGWTLSRRCRAGEWTSAVRMALEGRGLMEKGRCLESGLVLRSDNGAQPCSREFVAFLSARGVTGQYTGYDAPDDNAYVERVMRTIKEEEIWVNQWDSWSEADAAIERYIEYYNRDRVHSSLGYRTPSEAAAAYLALVAA